MKTVGKQQLMEQIYQEHQELRDLLDCLQHALAQRLRTVASVSELLAAASDQLETQFSQQQELGFIDATCDGPAELEARTKELRQLHASMIQPITELVKRIVECNEVDDWWQQAEKGILTFRLALSQHGDETNHVLSD